MVRRAFDNPYDNARDPVSAIDGRITGENANCAKDVHVFDYYQDHRFKLQTQGNL